MWFRQSNQFIIAQVYFLSSISLKYIFSLFYTTLHHCQEPWIGRHYHGIIYRYKECSSLQINVHPFTGYILSNSRREKIKLLEANSVPIPCQYHWLQQTVLYLFVRLTHVKYPRVNPSGRTFSICYMILHLKQIKQSFTFGKVKDSRNRFEFCVMKWMERYR